MEIYIYKKAKVEVFSLVRSQEVSFSLVYCSQSQFQEKMMKHFAILLALGFFELIHANTPIASPLFVSNPLAAAALAAPLWHFDIKTCFPTAAVQADGSQTPGLPADYCAIDGALNKGCPVQAAQTQKEQTSTSFPTYVTVRQCSKDGSWRIVYDVYFQKVNCMEIIIRRFTDLKQDTGHSNDWEVSSPTLAIHMSSLGRLAAHHRTAPVMLVLD